MRSARRRNRQQGVVGAEFLIAIGPFTLLFTGLIQLTLISAAKLAVHYAAACAARAAVVVVPDEEENGHQAGNNRIRDAAVTALLPLASTAQANNTMTDAFRRGANWGEVENATGIILKQGRLEGEQYDAQIKTRVVYAYHCTVPFANRFFCSLVGQLPDAARKDLEDAHVHVGAGRYLILRAEQTLTKQGRPEPQANPEKEE